MDQNYHRVHNFDEISREAAGILNGDMRWDIETDSASYYARIFGTNLRAPLKMRFFSGSIVGDVLASSCMAYTLRCCVRRRLTTTEKSLFLEAPLTDEVYLEYSQVLVVLGGFASQLTQPRTFGLELGFKYWVPY